jgi:hypothetical protein
MKFAPLDTFFSRLRMVLEVLQSAEVIATMPRTHLQCRLPAPPRGRRQLSSRAHHVRATRSAPDRSRSSTAAYVAVGGSVGQALR